MIDRTKYNAAILAFVDIPSLPEDTWGPFWHGVLLDFMAARPPVWLPNNVFSRFRRLARKIAVLEKYRD